VEKKCTKCLGLKPLDQFNKRTENSSGFYSWCRTCVSAYNREYRINNPDKASANQRRSRLRKFGLTDASWQVMSDAQGGVCAVCRRPETAVLYGVVKTLSVDHCHVTGLNRGLLCSRCNPMLGYAEDNIETLEAAIAYLRSY